MTLLDAVRSEGANSFICGLRQSDCPYTGTLAMAWLRGWSQQAGRA